MPKMKPDRDDRQGGLGLGGPQDGAIGEASDSRQQQQQDPSREESGGIGSGDQGEGGQRHPGGSSRGDERQS